MSTNKDKLLEYSMSQNIMSSKSLSLLVVFFLAAIAIMPANSATNTDGQSNDVYLEIETQGGTIFDDFVNISGKSSIPVSELVWSIDHIEQFNTFAISTNSIVTSSTFTEVNVYNDIFHWDLSIPVGELNCTCTFSIAVPNHSSLQEESIVVFIGQYNHFSVINYQPSFNNVENSNSKLLTYEVIHLENTEISISEYINNVAFKADICQYSGNSCVSETRRVVLNHTIENDNLFLVEINQEFLDLDDGNWHFEIFMRDSYLRFSNVDEKILTFDTMAPEVEILGAVSASEMDTEVFSVKVDDGYDSSLVALTWTIKEPSGLVRGLIGNEYISDSSLMVEFNQSGIWNISVLAIDSVGHFTKQHHEVNIVNIAPEITLLAPSSESSDAIKIVTEISQQWYIDASMTYDTSNDVDDLIFQWIVDGEIIHVGDNLSDANFEKSGIYAVTLVVTDNDGLSTTSQIELLIESEGGSTDSKVSTILIAICILLICLSVIFLIRFSRDENTFNLPKWGK